MTSSTPPSPPRPKGFMRGWDDDTVEIPFFRIERPLDEQYTPFSLKSDVNLKNLDENNEELKRIQMDRLNELKQRLREGEPGIAESQPVNQLRRIGDPPPPLSLIHI